jgi:hypothetical protein
LHAGLIAILHAVGADLLGVLLAILALLGDEALAVGGSPPAAGGSIRCQLLRASSWGRCVAGSLALDLSRGFLLGLLRELFKLARRFGRFPCGGDGGADRALLREALDL